MAELATTLSIVNGSFSLVVKCTSVVQQLYTLVDKLKNANLTLCTIAEECEMVMLAWNRIDQWARDPKMVVESDTELICRLSQSIMTGTMIFSALQQDLMTLDGDSSTGFWKRSRIVWNEDIFRAHQDRIRSLVASMTLLLEVVRLYVF